MDLGPIQATRKAVVHRIVGHSIFNIRLTLHDTNAMRSLNMALVPPGVARNVEVQQEEETCVADPNSGIPRVTMCVATQCTRNGQPQSACRVCVLDCCGEGTRGHDLAHHRATTVFLRVEYAR